MDSIKPFGSAAIPSTSSSRTQPPKPQGPKKSCFRAPNAPPSKKTVHFGLIYTETEQGTIVQNKIPEENEKSHLITTEKHPNSPEEKNKNCATSTSRVTKSIQISIEQLPSEPSEIVEETPAKSKTQEEEMSRPIKVTELISVNSNTADVNSIKTEAIKTSSRRKIPEKLETKPTENKADSPINFNGINHVTTDSFVSISQLLYAEGRWLLITADQVKFKCTQQMIVAIPGPPPLQKVRESWNSGFIFRQFSIYQNSWILIADLPSDQRLRITFQSLDSFSKFPSAFIKQVWDQKGRINYLNYHDKMWYLLSEKPNSTNPAASLINFNRSQTLYFKKDIPTEQLKLAWQNLREVVSVAYGKRRWIVITQKRKKIPKQNMHLATDFAGLVKLVGDLYKEEKKVRCLCFAEKLKTWLVISEEMESGSKQDFFADFVFPSEKLEDFGFHV